MLPVIKAILGIGGAVLDKVMPNRTASQEKNLEINAETERASGGAMTPRKLLMYVIVVLLAWEMMLRPIISTYVPEAELPPSMLEELMAVAAAMFGFGF